MRTSGFPLISGDYVSKKDLDDDMSVSFDDLLSSMKEEDGNHTFS